MAHLAQRLAELEVLRPDVGADEAADLPWVMASLDRFDAPYTGCDLSVDEFARMLITTAERTLCR